MTIRITEGTIGLWFVTLAPDPNDVGDWLSSVRREGDKYILTYRFRYYEDDKTFDSNDRKSWYEATTDVNETDLEEILASMRGAAEMIWKKGGGKRWELLKEDMTIEAFMHEWAKLPFVTHKVEDAEGRPL